MKEVVVAVFDSSSTADAVHDLKVARIPSAVVQRLMGKSALSNDTAQTRPRPMVKVMVDEMHADAVTGILRLYGHLNLEKHKPGGRRIPRGNTRARRHVLGFGSRLAAALS